MSIYETLGKAAFYQQSPALSAQLTLAYPNGCTLAEAIEWAQAIKWRLTHFTPQSMPHWKWMFMFHIMDVEGWQECIDGTKVFANPTSAWSGCNELPSFDTEYDARRWAEQNGFQYTLEERYAVFRPDGSMRIAGSYGYCHAYAHEGDTITPVKEITCKGTRLAAMI